ncbi:hypothetical protein AYK24_01870 [Thermoplasmatales archaeon SG8-52-4]|nr:MAG: hypothetical protein AYK24_01870 [Thermoplasmatales archaeon SG8-52-4]
MKLPRIKNITLVLIILIIFLFSIMGLFFLNIQLLKSPEIIIKIEVSEVNSKEAIISTTLDIDNPNSFDINIKNLKIVMFTPDGYKIAQASLKGGKILSYKNNTFTSDILVLFNGHSPELITTKVSCEASANLLFIEKTIPINIGIITNIEEFLNDISVPTLSVTIESIDLAQGGLDLKNSIEISNLNTFDIYIDDITFEIKSETDKVIGNAIINGGIVPAKDILLVQSKLTVLFESLNFEMLTMDISGNARAKIAGFDKEIPFNVQTKIVVPDLEDILLSKSSPTLISIKLDEKFTLKGILFYVTLEVFNNYNIDLVIRDITIGIYSVINDNNYLIGENHNISDIISKVGTSGYLTCKILVPYSKLLKNIGSLDWIMASGVGRVSIEGINQSAFIEIRGYHSLHPFR